MEEKQTGQWHLYQIRIKETLGPATLDWVNGLDVDPHHDGGTVLSGWFPDQPALRGLLEYLWNLNLTILSIAIIEEAESSTADLQRRKK